MRQPEIDKLDYIVQQFAKLNDAIKAAQDEQKELGQAAFDDRLIHVSDVPDACKVLRRLAKERDWDEIKRMAQAQLEQALDECRAALGLLADLPLGQAAQQRQDQAEQPERRGRGRPKGAKNKPKLATSNGADVASSEPPVPDIPDLSAA